MTSAWPKFIGKPSALDKLVRERQSDVVDAAAGTTLFKGIDAERLAARFAAKEAGMYRTGLLKD